MNTVRMILCGNVEDSRMNPSEKVGEISWGISKGRVR